VAAAKPLSTCVRPVRLVVVDTTKEGQKILWLGPVALLWTHDVCLLPLTLR
jgi:hypothetical protein